MEFVKGKGFRTKNDPQTIIKVCRSLEKDGKVIPKDLVDASRPKDAP